MVVCQNGIDGVGSVPTRIGCVRAVFTVAAPGAEAG